MKVRGFPKKKAHAKQSLQKIYRTFKLLNISFLYTDRNDKGKVLTPYDFEGLSNLKKLRLGIKDIYGKAKASGDVKVFGNAAIYLPSLSLPEGIFDGLSRLEVLNLSGNRDLFFKGRDFLWTLKFESA